MGSEGWRLCLQRGLRPVSGEGYTCAGSDSGIVQIGELILLLSPRSESFVCHCKVMGDCLFCFPLNPFSSAGKPFCTVAYFCVGWNFRVFYDFCQICPCWFAEPYYFLGLFIGVAVIGDENHQTLVVVYCADIFTILKDVYFSRVLVTVVFCRFKFRPTLLVLFFNHSISPLIILHFN